MGNVRTWVRRAAAACLITGSLVGSGVAAQLAQVRPAGAVPPGTGSITGTVTVAGGVTPAAGVCVSAEFSDATFAPTVMTAANGTYTVPNLAAGTYYVTFFDGPPCVTTAANYADTFYNGTATGTLVGSAATLVTVAAGTPTPGIDGQMTPGGSVTGTVTSSATGAALAGACVGATWNNGGPDFENVAADADGNLPALRT